METKNKNFEKRDKISDETYEELLSTIKEKHKCILIRPTGFGKTYLLAKISNEYDKVLYLYPLNVIKKDVIEKYKDIINPKIKFMTYMKLARVYETDKERLIDALSKFDLIILDEAHMAGADKTAKALKYIMNNCKDKDYLGATATPYRSDNYDVTSELFDNITISEYGLHDAIRDGLIEKPYYIYSTYDVVDSLSGLVKGANEIKDKNKRKDFMDKVRALDLEMSTMLNAPEIIKHHINELYNNINYMKFMIFFSDKAALDAKYEEVEGWFMQAFPDMHIRKLVITSDYEYANNIDELLGLKNTKNVIDLIFCIDMLNMGHHIDDLTGIMMLRNTSSNIIYKQQMGRCLSVASKQTPIVFDFVNNIDRGFLYSDKFRMNRKYNGSGRHSDINDFNEADLIINDRLASYRQIILKMTEGLEDETGKDMVYFYVDRQMPIKKLAEWFGCSVEFCRKQLVKQGVTVED